MPRPLAAAVLLFATLPLPITFAQAATPPAASSPATTQASTQPLAPGDFGLMIEMFKLEGEPLARFLDKVRVWREEIDRWHASDRHKQAEALRTEIAKAREAKDEAKVAELEARDKAHHKAYWEMRARGRAGIIASLTPEQQERWVCESTWRGITGTFKRAELTAEQVERAKGLCLEFSRELMRERPALLAEDPYLTVLRTRRDPLIERVRVEVLTDAQREKVPPRAPATRPATQPATQHAGGAPESATK